ncbi:hypothetical protein F5Y16DRAFT_378913 [Xylariaceae sp. FL0255]|nr:hypothetical protein F5Y16DRAFT_378913 [Xylariaceae sp. FL0255]
MDWARQRWELSEWDLETFEYAERKCKVIRLGFDDCGDRIVRSTDLVTKKDWALEFESEKEALEICKPTTCVILGSRSHQSNEGLSSLPFARSVFDNVTERFCVHESVARTIFRNYAGTFTQTRLLHGKTSKRAVVYNCRSSAHWDNDLALSVTYFPETGSIFGIFYGCNDHSLGKTVMTKIANRLSRSSEDAFTHPMLLVGLFVEMERARLRGLVSNAKIALQDIIDNLQRSGYSAISQSDKSPADPWLGIYTIKNGLELWTKLLLKMISHIDELDRDAGLQPPCRSGQSDDSYSRTGQRIKDRLEEIHLEFEGLVKECEMIIDGMTLATNLAIARDNMQDGKRMKSIAVVTMVFLPATSVATFFSMTILSLDPSYIWLYPSITIPLTILVLCIYRLDILRTWQKQSLHKASTTAEKSINDSLDVHIKDGHTKDCHFRRYCCLV